MKQPKRTLQPFRLLNPPEFETLLQAAPPRILPAVVIGGFCGLRTGEIQELEWSRINLIRKEILVETGFKTRHRRVASIPDAAVAWLAPFAKTSGRVVRHRSTSSLASAIQQLQKSVGIHPVSGGLRRSAAPYLFALAESTTKTANELGIPASLIIKNLERPLHNNAKKWFAIFPHPK